MFQSGSGKLQLALYLVDCLFLLLTFGFGYFEVFCGVCVGVSGLALRFVTCACGLCTCGLEQLEHFSSFGISSGTEYCGL